MLPAKIETERLRLRPVRVADAEVIFSLYATDTEVTRYLTWKPHSSVAETREFLEICEKAWSQGTSCPWAIERREDRQLLGMIGAMFDHGINLGYVLAQRFWGNGYMSEAVRAVIAAAFAEGDVYRVWAVCDLENRASARVMEKGGMQREGILRRYEVAPNLSPVPRDVYCYSIVRE